MSTFDLAAIATAAADVKDAGAREVLLSMLDDEDKAKVYAIISERATAAARSAVIGKLTAKVGADNAAFLLDAVQDIADAVLVMDPRQKSEQATTYKFSRALNLHAVRANGETVLVKIDVQTVTR